MVARAARLVGTARLVGIVERVARLVGMEPRGWRMRAWQIE